MIQENKKLLFKKENKELLLKDLCCRLPYHVKMENRLGSNYELVLGNADLTRLYYNDFGIYSEINLSLPYLFPMSSMTDEQKKYINNRWNINENFDFEIDPNWGKYFVDLGDVIDYINWLNKNHFDYRGLIKKGLAIDCTNLNIY